MLNRHRNAHVALRRKAHPFRLPPLSGYTLFEQTVRQHEGAQSGCHARGSMPRELRERATRLSRLEAAVAALPAQYSALGMHSVMRLTSGAPHVARLHRPPAPMRARIRSRRR